MKVKLDTYDFAVVLHNMNKHKWDLNFCPRLEMSVI